MSDIFRNLQKKKGRFDTIFKYPYMHTNAHLYVKVYIL